MAEAGGQGSVRPPPNFVRIEGTSGQRWRAALLLANSEFLDLAPSLNSVTSLWNLSLVLGPLALELYYYILFFSLFNFHPLIPFSGIESSMFL